MKTLSSLRFIALFLMAYLMLPTTMFAQLKNDYFFCVDDSNCQWEGLNCIGDATLILADGTTNTVKGFYRGYAGIHVNSTNTLTIQGTGALNASSNGGGAGIGCNYAGDCGNIIINGGTITATGAHAAAGIGTGNASTCGNITISDAVTLVTATKGSGAINSIGIGSNSVYYPGSPAVCGTVTIGGTVYWDGSAYQNGGENYLTRGTLIYQAP